VPTYAVSQQVDCLDSYIKGAIMAPKEGELTPDQQRAVDLLEAEGLEVLLWPQPDGTWMVSGASPGFYPPEMGACHAW